MCLFVIRSTRRAEGSGYELQNGSSAGRDLHRVDHRVMRSEDMLQRMSRDLVGDVFKAVGCFAVSDSSVDRWTATVQAVRCWNTPFCPSSHIDIDDTGDQSA